MEPHGTFLQHGKGTAGHGFWEAPRIFPIGVPRQLSRERLRLIYAAFYVFMGLFALTSLQDDGLTSDSVSKQASCAESRMQCQT